LHHIAARDESMMEKELVVALSAYNLVRAVMARGAAPQAGAPATEFHLRAQRGQRFLAPAAVGV
jgi:hypothetical protein